MMTIPEPAEAGADIGQLDRPEVAEPPIVGFETRYLYAFRFEASQVDAIIRKLLGDTFTTLKGKVKPIWRAPRRKPDGSLEVDEHYHDELFEAVKKYLFTQGAGDDCRYLRVDEVLNSTWFKKHLYCFWDEAEPARLSGAPNPATAQDKPDNTKPTRIERRVPVELASGVRIEIILTPMGVGVLSLALAFGGEECSIATCTAANYHLSQFRRHARHVAFRHKDLRDDPRLWQSLTADQQESIVVAKPESPLEIRLQAAGGEFTLVEVIDRLLQPLDAGNSGMDLSVKEVASVQLRSDDGNTLFEEFVVQASAPSESIPAQLEPLQNELFAYTVVQLPAGRDFDRVEDRDELAPWLARLTQVEEATHPSFGPQSLNIANKMLNRLHWVGVGQLGVAHFVVEQRSLHGAGDPPKFNEQKPVVVRDKYFVPYLIALLQKLTLIRSIRDVRLIAATPEGDLPKKVAAFRRRLLQFGVRGSFVQVSARDALHRYYQLIQGGLDIAAAWQSLHAAIEGLEASANASFQREQLAAQSKLTHSMHQTLRAIQHVENHQNDQLKAQAAMTESMDRNLDEINAVQTFLHFLEYILVSVYLAHLWHMFSEPLLADHEHGHAIIAIGVIVAAVLGLLFVYLCERKGWPQRLHRYMKRSLQDHRQHK